MLIVCIALACAAAVSTRITEPSPAPRPFLPGSMASAPVRSTLERACRDCHSDNTVWPWYAQIPPVSSLVHGDVNRGRDFMNLSKWNEYTEGERQGFLAAIVTATDARMMPPSKYLWMHPNAKLTEAELELIRQWASEERAAAQNSGEAE